MHDHFERLTRHGGKFEAELDHHGAILNAKVTTGDGQLKYELQAGSTTAARAFVRAFVVVHTYRLASEVKEAQLAGYDVYQG